MFESVFICLPSAAHGSTRAAGGAAGTATGDGKSPRKPQELDVLCLFSGQV